MAYDPITNTFTVYNEADLNQAIADIDAVGKGGELASGAYTIRLAQDITLGGAATGNVKDVDGTTDLQVNGGTVANSSDLKAINLSTGTTLTIDGGSHSLDGGGTERGLFVYNGSVSVHDLTITHAVAQGGSGAGGGAGLGGGLFVAGTNPIGVGSKTTTPGGIVTLTNVTFTGDQAQGGAGNNLDSGGGGLGGPGDVGGGGVGLGAYGNGMNSGANGGAGIIVGAASGDSPQYTTGNYTLGGLGGRSGGGGGGGANKGSNSGGGGGVNGLKTDSNFDGGFGGGGGRSSTFAGPGGTGGFGGGGGTGGKQKGAGDPGGAGGFGGGGGNTESNVNGSSSLLTAPGGFGGGNGVPNAGGGGLGAGGAIFVQAGGQLILDGNVNISGGAVAPGKGPGNAGQAFASGIYLQGNNQLDFSTTDPTTGNATFPSISDVIGDDRGSAAAAAYTNPKGYEPGSVAVNVSGNGILSFSAVNTYSGPTTISGSAALVGAVSGALPTASAFAVGKGTSLLLASNQTIASLSDGPNGGGTVSAFLASAPPTLTLVGAADTSFSGTLADQTGLFGQQSLTLVKQGAGTQTLSGANTFSGGTTIAAGTLDLGAATAAGSGAITFDVTSGTATATLAIEAGGQPNSATFDNTLTGFNRTSALDLKGFVVSSTNYNNGILTLNGTLTSVGTSQAVVERYKFLNQSSDAFVTQDDGSGGTLVSVCFAAGTRIRVAREGRDLDVAVEGLRLGDHAVTLEGKHRTIRWLGHRTVDCRNHPRPHEAMPVRIAAQAFGDNRPSRDLFVSPGHAICVDALSEVLIPAAALVNGSTIQQVDVDAVTYWHVELDRHDILLAENLPAESYLDMGNRGFFAEGGVVALTALPDADPSQRTHADFCRPFVDGGPILEAVRLLLRQRAETIGWRSTDALEMHLVVDGQRLDPVVRGLTARFHVPPDARDIWLVSPTARPRDAAASGDGRDLGLYIGGLRIDDGFEMRQIAIDDPLLCIGFHAVEHGARRWTSGRARLPAALWDGCEGGFYLRVDLAGPPVSRWITPVAARRSCFSAKTSCCFELTSKLRPTAIDRKFGARRGGRVECEEEDGLRHFLRRPEALHRTGVAVPR